jgi:hypothetical protein
MLVIHAGCFIMSTSSHMVARKKTIEREAKKAAFIRRENLYCMR